jgi:anti-sigma regulatory factor (Ser/Thr protein kinase)
MANTLPTTMEYFDNLLGEQLTEGGGGSSDFSTATVSVTYNSPDNDIYAKVACVEDNTIISGTFIDRGTPYDPLAKEDPDITLSIEERQIGGLGIFMVKKSMDDVAYEYSDGQNILTLTKNLV